MASVQIDAVTKTYPGGVRALNRVSLTISDKQFVVLVGPSGCGKSTLLRMIAGLESITEGTISIGDRVVNSVAPKDRDVAMVFQNYALYPHMSVFDNMAFGLRMRSVSSTTIKERVTTTAEMLGLSSLLDRKPRQLSGGQAQRVAVGRAIVRNPAVFLFDEPLSNLDAQHRATMRRELSDLHRRLQATMILVTHDQVEAMTLGERIVVMHAGEVQQVGDPKSVYDHPANRFVAGFVGTPSMNFVPAILRTGGPAPAIEIGEARWVIPSGIVKSRPMADGTMVTIGIRPEAFSVNADGDVRAELNEVQHLGNEQLAFFRWVGVECVARLEARADLQRGSPVGLAVDPERIHVFDANGQNLAGAAPAFSTSATCPPA